MAEAMAAVDAAPIPSIHEARLKGEPRTFAAFEENLRAFVITGVRTLDPDDCDSFIGLVRLLNDRFRVEVPQKQLAMRLRVTPMTIQRWVNGVSLPRPGPRAHFYSDMVALLVEALEGAPLTSQSPVTATVSAIS